MDSSSQVELNVMPFIDIFSLLCTFLLFSAVFVSVGIHTVQVPFISNAPAPKQASNEKPKPQVDIKVDADKTKIKLIVSVNGKEKHEDFAFDQSGLNELHESLIKVRGKYKDEDKLSLFSDDELTYDDLIRLLDVIRIRNLTGPSEGSNGSDGSLFPKVVLGSVIL